MEMNYYQRAALLTAVYPNKKTTGGLIYCILKLNGEAGEIAEKMGKHLRGDTKTLDKEALQLELGDVLWYVAALASELDCSLNDIARLNLEKLADRAARGTLQGEGDKR